jgi:DNA-binding beta-propeller fold protein YncE
VDAAGDVYVADSFNSRIQVFSPAGAFLRKWGTAGTGNGQFIFPHGIRVSAGGTVYVADRNNNRVQYFDTAGNFLGQWGSTGSGDGQFNGPAGIGIDPAGNVVVGDHGNNRIQKFTATGTFVDKLGPITTAGNLALPHGAAFPPSGRSVYIADFNNGRVVKFATPGGWNWSYTPADGAAGPTTVTITATDNFGAADTTTFTLNVNNVAPTIALTGNATVPNGAPYTLNLGAITDPGTDTVSAFSINWGDGNTENFTGNPASTAKTHTYATLGAKTITVTLTDEDGTVTGGTRSVTVENAAPVAGADGLNRPNTTTVAKVLKSVLLGNDSDADLDPLTLTAVGNAQPAGATVTLAGNFVVYTAPANNAGNGSFTYTLSAGAHSVTGTVTVTETSTSGGGGGTPNYLTLVPSGNDFVVTFLGVPGGSFRVQYSTSTAPPYVWTEFAPQATYTAAPNGVFTHTDVNPPGPVRFYRAVSNP